MKKAAGVIKSSLIAMIFFGLGCSGNLFENENGTIYAELREDELAIMNGRDESIYYAALDLETSYVVDLMLVSSEENRIYPNSSKSIPKNEILGYREGGKVIIYIWNGREGGGYYSESIIVD